MGLLPLMPWLWLTWNSYAALWWLWLELVLSYVVEDVVFQLWLLLDVSAMGLE